MKVPTTIKNDSGGERGGDLENRGTEFPVVEPEPFEAFHRFTSSHRVWFIDADVAIQHVAIDRADDQDFVRIRFHFGAGAKPLGDIFAAKSGEVVDLFPFFVLGTDEDPGRVHFVAHDSKMEDRVDVESVAIFAAEFCGAALIGADLERKPVVVIAGPDFEREADLFQVSSTTS